MPKRKPASEKKRDSQGRVIRQTPVVEILKKCRSTIDYGPIGDDGYSTSWEWIISDKMSDCWSGDLVDDIAEHGMLSPIDWDGREIGNGHHRFVIALLLGWDTVPTTKGSEWSEWWGRGSCYDDFYKEDSGSSLTDEFTLV